MHTHPLLHTHPLPTHLPQVHGFPKVMGVLTHLDGFKDNKRLKKTKKALKHRFWTEIYQGGWTHFVRWWLWCVGVLGWESGVG